MKGTPQDHLYTRRDVLKLSGITGAALAGGVLLAGCSSSGGSSAASASASGSAASASASGSAASASASTSASSASVVSLAGKELNIYCGAGMTDPFTEISDAFKAASSCEMNVTFGNAATIQNSIKETQEGDFFIAGAKDELKPVEEYVKESIDLVKHIPVIVVPKDNPKNITSLADLANCDTLLIGDPESTPIGKIAKKALTDAGIWDELDAKGAISTTTTAPQIATQIASGNGDAGIVWKENVKDDGSKAIDSDLSTNYTKVIPAALLTCVGDEEAAAEFMKYLQTSDAQDIWTKYGYELA